jgi:hypothetical protein
MVGFISNLGIRDEIGQKSRMVDLFGFESINIQGFEVLRVKGALGFRV